jgi:organic hydroperoxide reductase OsmC/OhrA
MNSPPQIKDALLRAREAFERRPSSALHEDSAATAVWQGGLGTTLVHASVNGLRTAMPAVIGGSGDAPSPGWYFRAGIASCLATSIAMHAALRGIALAHLEVEAHSESDTRGVLGTRDVPAGPVRSWLEVTVRAPECTEAELQALVDDAHAASPMADALRRPLAVDVRVRIASAPAA